MAEYVHQTLEEMLPELEQMNELGLFSTKETKVILKTRESLEYRLRQLTKTKASFLNYIEYEKKVLELLKIRRKKTANDSKKREIEKSIADRIHQLYRLVTTRFKEDVTLWQQHIDFSKALREKAYVSRLYDRALKIHGHNEGLWVEASRWEMSQDGNNDPQQAREILLQGQRINPESETILLEMFSMELELASTILRRKSILGINQESTDGKSEGPKELKLAEIVYRKGIELMPGNTEFHLKLLSVCSTCREARDLQQSICTDLRELYPSSASVWNGLAWIHLTSFKHMNQDERSAAVQKCLGVYEEAVSQCNTESMWSSCLCSHLSLLDSKGLNTTTRQAVLHSTLHHFQTGIQTQTLSEEMFLQLIHLLSELSQHKDAAKVAEWGTQCHPGSSSLWLARLTHASSSEVTATLRSALTHVADSWPLWQLALTLLASREDSSQELEELVLKACRTTGVAEQAKVWNLVWVFRRQGIKSARATYLQWKTTRPISLDFYRTYIQAECAQPKPDSVRVRAVFEEALVEFGQSDPDLWLNYMQFEASVAHDPSRSGSIGQRALNGLDPKLKESFLRKQAVGALRA